LIVLIYKPHKNAESVSSSSSEQSVGHKNPNYRHQEADGPYPSRRGGLCKGYLWPMVLPAKRHILRVDPTRLELVTSAMRIQHYRFLKASRVCKIPGNKRIIHPVLFLGYQDIYSGCCTVAAHIEHALQTRTCNLWLVVIFLRGQEGIRRHMGLWYRGGIEVLWTHVFAEWNIRACSVSHPV
jgi:hypothetical protein